MSGIEPSVLVRELEALGDDLRRIVASEAEVTRGALASVASRPVERVYLTGCGDSLHAARAAASAFQSFAGIVAHTPRAMDLIRFAGEPASSAEAERAWVVVSSASGRTPRAVEAVEAARRCGLPTLAVTSDSESPLARAAEGVVVFELAGKERSPGLRTYQATLAGLLLLSIRLGERRRVLDAVEAGHLRRELTRAAGVVEATVEADRSPCHEVASRLAGVPALMVLGSGPAYGTAGFAAAKLVETAGVFAVAQDLEEWWHAERFALPEDMPLFVLAAPGSSYWRAVRLAHAARELGRRVFAVACEDDTEVAPLADATLPVKGHLREELAGLAYHVFSGLVAVSLAEQLGRRPFLGDRPDLVRVMRRHNARLPRSAASAAEEVLARACVAWSREVCAEAGPPDAAGEPVGSPQARYLLGIARRVLDEWGEAVRDEEEAGRPPQSWSEAGAQASAELGDDALLDMLDHCRAKAGDFLSGRISGVQAVFLGEGFDLWNRLQGESRFMRHFARAGAAVAETRMGEAARVLELGAGTGAGTAALLSRAGARIAEYTYTDVGETFLRRGRARFGGRPGLTFRTLDFNAPARAQGFEEASFDLVFEVNALHVARDLVASLEVARSLLVPGGVLVLAEGSPTARVWLPELVFGFLEQWWNLRASGDPERPSGFVPADHWLSCLDRAGFRGARVVDDGPTHNVLVARREGP